MAELSEVTRQLGRSSPLLLLAEGGRRRGWAGAPERV